MAEKNYEEMKANIEELIQEAEQKLIEIPKEKGYLKAAIEQQINNLKNLPDQFELKDYRLVFMGKQGCGKTTSITNLCNLIVDELTGKKIDKISLLPTGSGGTTSAETIEICQTEGTGTYFLVTCGSKNELHAQVVTYIEEIYIGLLNEKLKTVEKNPNGAEPDHIDPIILPGEIKRCIANMCVGFIQNRSDVAEWCGDSFYNDFPEDQNPNPQQNLERLIKCAIRKKDERDHLLDTGDLQEEFVKELASFIINLMGEFYSEISDKDDIDLEIKGENVTNIKDFIQSTLSDLNVGKYREAGKTLSLIKKIVLYIDTKDIDMNLHSEDGTIHITSVIDTRGFMPGEHGDGERDDYRKYFEDYGDICILTEKYVNTSNGQLGVIEDILKYNMKMHYKTGLKTVLINWETGEPASNLDNQIDDADDNEEKYVKRRCDQVSEYLKNTGYHFDSDNVISYNPLSGYEYNQNKKILQCDVDGAKAARNNFMNSIRGLVEREKENLLKKIRDNYDLLEKFVTFGTISIRDESVKIIHELQSAIDSQLKKLREDMVDFPFYKHYSKYISGFHSRAYKPLARHCGEYTSVNGDISLFSLGVPLAEFYEEIFKGVCEVLEDKIQDIKKECRGASDEHEVVALLDNYYNATIDEVSKLFDGEMRKDYESWLRNDRIFGSFSDVWNKTQTDSGSGVNNRIKNVFLEYVGEREMRGTSDDFPTSCRKEQEKINKRIPEIIDTCFGQKLQRD